MPAALADRAPRVVEFEDGRQAWEYEGKLYPNVGLNAVVGRPRDEWSMEPARFDEMRPGCYDIHERIRDMDAGGIWASVCFPSLIAGFCGAVFSRSKDPELGWHHAGLERLAPGRVGRHLPRTDHPVAVDLAPGSRGRRRRDPAQRRAGLQGGELRKRR